MKKLLQNGKKSLKVHTMSQTKNITGRDAYIMAQALYQACKYQEDLKRSGSTHYEWSNHQDMKAILNGIFPSWAELFVLQEKMVGTDPADLNDEKERNAMERKEVS